MVSRMRSWDIKKILSKNEGNLDKVSALANNIYVGSFIVTNMDNKMSILRDIRYTYIGVILLSPLFYKPKYLKLRLLQNQLRKPQKNILADRLNHTGNMGT